MKNVEWTLDGDLVTIRIDLTQEFAHQAGAKPRLLPARKAMYRWGPSGTRRSG